MLLTNTAHGERINFCCFFVYMGLGENKFLCIFDLGVEFWGKKKRKEVIG
jgi:hypothetical protein